MMIFDPMIILAVVIVAILIAVALIRSIQELSRRRELERMLREEDLDSDERRNVILELQYLQQKRIADVFFSRMWRK